MNILKHLENVLLKNYQEEYKTFINDYKTDKVLFYNKNIDIIGIELNNFLKKQIYDDTLFWLFSVGKRLMYEIDENKCENYKNYDKQVENEIKTMLKKHGVKEFSFQNKNISKETDKILDKYPQGDYFSIFFEKVNKELKILNFELLIYRNNFYFILPTNEYRMIVGDDHQDIVFDTKIYETYLKTGNKMNAKIMKFIKDYFELQLNEVKEIIKQDRILLKIGNKIEINEIIAEMEDIGGEIIIEEKIM